ncbi:MAG: hypothetical protein KME50_08870 [Nostoc desertorum CM1-VF14]|nr:hypothetical protein [Nostoc desertorum CM1-VF14]
MEVPYLAIDLRSFLADASHDRTSKGDAYGRLRLRKKTTLMYYVKQVARPPAWVLF